MKMKIKSKMKKKICMASLIATTILATLSSIGIAQESSKQNEIHASMSTDHFNTWTSHVYIKEPVMNDQFKWVFSQMLYGKADMGECLDVATKIISGSEESWLIEWTKLANKLKNEADVLDSKGKTFSAANTYYRASTYYRAALIHFANPFDARVIENTKKSEFCYDKANALSKVPVVKVKIPYETSFLPGYYFKSPNVKTAKAPLIIMHQGRDGWPEDTSWIYENAMKRGINVLMVHAPGQGAALRLNKLYFRPDWEKVITPIVDFAIKFDDVDTSRMALMGLSMGGTLVPRAAAFEHRFKLVIADPGVLNWGDASLAHMAAIPNFKKLLLENPVAFDAMMEKMMKVSPYMDWGMRDYAGKMGVTKPSELFLELLKYNNEPIVDKIRTPMLILDGEEEAASAGQAKKLYDALKGKKYYMYFDKESGSQLHCQNGGLSRAANMLFDYLEENL